ncbi:MAG TPA: glucose-6-phosphate isomerase, partial [Candidatus Gracilibacteria bacterium]
TAASLEELGRDSVTIQIDGVEARTLGELFFLLQGATAFLGEFLDIDAFDQPGVERGKVLTREYLSTSSN